MAKHKKNYTLLTEAGMLTGETTGKLLRPANRKAIFPRLGLGALMIVDEGCALTHQVLQRKNHLARKGC